MTALRIALIASNRFPIREPFAGGLEAHVWHLARALADAGHQVSLFGASGSDPALNCKQLHVSELMLSPAAANDAAMPDEAFMSDHHAYLSLMLALSNVDAPFDVIHNHSLHHLPVALAPLLSIPMLATLHTPPTPWLESAIQATGAVGVDFAAVSGHTASAWGHLLRRVAVVPNGVDTDRWAFGAGGKYLVWFGRLTPEKAPHLAIAAAKRAGLPLVLAGPISHPEYVRDEIEPLLCGSISYAGHLDQERLIQLVSGAAAALVTPQWDEPYGLVVAESLSCGTPVVAFARGGIPEVMDDRCGRLVHPGDVAAMAAAIPEAAGLSRAAVRAHALTNCSSHTMVSSYLDIYRELIEGRNGGTDDRLLRPPSRRRPSQSGFEHLRAPA
jgi:glycosyltransferase involved in cell wall biosynthesis